MTKFPFFLGPPSYIYIGCGRETYFFEKRAKRQGVKVGSWEGVRPKG